MTHPDPHEYIQWRGVTIDRRTAAALSVVEERLGYQLTLVKAHDPRDSAVSSNTHKGTGVVDLAPADADNKMRELKKIGFAPYHRIPADGFPEHLHIILRGQGHGLDPEAQRQVNDWMMTPPRNGLANHGLDRDPGRPNPLPEEFSYAAWWRDGILDKKITGVNARIKTWREKIAAAKTRRAMLKSNKTYS